METVQAAVANSIGIMLGLAFLGLGIGVGLFIYITMLCSIKSFGVPYTTPLAPSYKTNGNGFFIPPIWKQQYRAGFLSPKRKQAQGDVSMKWKV